MCHFWAQNGPFVLNNFFLVQTVIITLIYLLALFIVQNFLKSYYSISRVMRTRHFWVQNNPFAPSNFFLKRLWTLFSYTYWPLSLWRTLKKNSYSGSTVMSMCHFLGHKWLTCQNQDFFRKPENNACSFHS